jgi:hypothetical protein
MDRAKKAPYSGASSSSPSAASRAKTSEGPSSSIRSTYSSRQSTVQHIKDNAAPALYTGSRVQLTQHILLGARPHALLKGLVRRVAKQMEDHRMIDSTKGPLI